MNNELIMPTILIKDKKKTISGSVVRAVICGTSKILQVQIADAEDYYLIYFRNTCIFGDQLATVQEGSFIAQAFRDGLVIETSHPILSAVVPKQMVSIQPRNKLFLQLQNHFSPQEISYIATTLDAFFEKTTLVKVIDQFYFEYKRNGQFLKAYQILQILQEFVPELKSVKERISSREFHSAHLFYHSSGFTDILKKDPLYIELFCFKNRFIPDARNMLEEILKESQAYVELILLWFEQVKSSHDTGKLKDYTEIALNFLPIDQWILILAEEKINPFHVLPEAKIMIDNMIKKGNYETAAISLLNFMDDLPTSYESILKKVWESAGVEFVEAHLAQFVKIIKRHGNDDYSQHLETQIYQLIVMMLKEFDLKTVYEKLLPLEKALQHSFQIRKLKKMVELQEDPDRMMELGDYFAEFKQYDPAIDCYSWEMELKPQDPDPVLKISKMYQKKGMAAEAAVYQKVFSQLKDI
jgi:tetratricopeptide (TPR) repeat protein